MDSLKTELGQTQDGHRQAILYSELAESWKHENLDSAIQCGLAGLRLAEKHDDEEGQAENCFVLGDLYIVSNELDRAREFYSRARASYQNALDTLGYAQTLMKLGNIALAQSKHLEALHLYEACLELSLPNKYGEIVPHVYNNLGVLYLQLEDYEASFPFFEKAREFFQGEGDEYNLAISLINLANIQTLQNEDDEALANYRNAMPSFMKHENWLEASFTHNLVAGVFLKRNQNDSAETHLELSLNLLERSKGEYSGPSSIHTTKIYSNIAELRYRQKDLSESMKYAKFALDQSLANSYTADYASNAKLISLLFDEMHLPDSALAYYKKYMESWDSIKKEETKKKVLQLRMQTEQDAIVSENLLENQRKEAANRQKVNWYKTIATVGLLVVIILILLYRNQKTKTVKILLQQKNLQLEKEKLDREISHKDKELATNMMYLVEKNEFITSLAKKMYSIKETFGQANQEVVQQIINELKQNASTKAWEEFELRFIDVHTEFYNVLSNSFPDLTPNELKLCAFLRMNMTTKEISAITHQSVKSIEMARFRLRKKMKMDRDTNLIGFLNQM